MNETKKQIDTKKQPVMTLSYTGLRFNTASVEALGHCKKVYFLARPDQKLFAVMAANGTGEFCGVYPFSWLTKKKAGSESIDIRSDNLPQRLYGLWSLDKSARYTAAGRVARVQYNDVLFFDFEESEPVPTPPQRKEY